MENPVETDPPLVHIIDPLPFSFSSENEIQAEEIKTASACILYRILPSRPGGHFRCAEGGTFISAKVGHFA